MMRNFFQFSEMGDVVAMVKAKNAPTGVDQFAYDGEVKNPMKFNKETRVLTFYTFTGEVDENRPSIIINEEDVFLK